MASWILSALMFAAVGGSSDCTLVHFTADWCEPCRQVSPALSQLQQEGYTVQTVNVDQHPELVAQFRIENLPTIVFLCREQEVDRMVGAASLELIQQRAARAAARNQSFSAPNNSASSVAAQNPQVARGPTKPPQAIVRGQSPGLAAFPMLASMGSEMQGSAEVPVQTASPQPVVGPQSISPQSVSPQSVSPQRAIGRAAAATVRIRVDEANTTAYGTGTIVDVHGEEALILTCGHLFRDMNAGSQLTIDLFPGTPQEVNLPSQLIDFKAEGEDIGLISCHIPVPIEPVPISARGKQIVAGQPAFSFGCDHGNNPTRHDTQVKSINRYLGADNIEIIGAPAVGRSGGGLFDVQGNLIGVCNAADTGGDEGIYAAAEVVYAQIERLGLAHLFSGQGTAELASNVRSDHAPTNSASPMQLVSSTPPPASPSWQPESGATQEQLQWPDQTATVPGSLASGNSPPSVTAAAVDSSATNTRQLICIVRDAAGQDRVVTIDAPPAQLLRLIQQSAN